MSEGLGKPQWATDPRYITNDLRSQNVDAIKDEMELVLRTNTTAHWIKVMDKVGVPCGPINNVAQSADHPQTLARNMIVNVEDPVSGPMRVVGNPVKISAFDDPTTREPAPNLDQDRDAILAELAD